MLLSTLDFCGTFLFALSGAHWGVRRRLDVFGVLVLAWATAVSGGLARDVLLGATPAAIADWRYLAVSTFAGLLAFARPGAVTKFGGPVIGFDAVGLGFFAVNGALKALDAGLSPMMAAIMGMITAVGGGVARDVLTMRVPMVLRADIYAVAALLGGLIAAFGVHLGAPIVPTVLLAGGACVTLRLTAWSRGWHLPRGAGAKAERADDDDALAPQPPLNSQ